MTLPAFRRSRQPAPSPAAAETFGRIPDWDGTTIEWGGASGAGLPGGDALYRRPGAAARIRQAITAEETAPWPEPPARPPDGAIWTILPGGGFGLLCGMDLWRRHADPEAAWYEDYFDALRVSALRAGWHPDLFGRWCCPRCQDDPFYTAPHPLAHYHPGVPHALAGPDPFESVRFWNARAATEHHEDAAAAWIDGDPAAEFWLRAEAEQAMLCRTAEGALHGRHEAGAR